MMASVKPKSIEWMCDGCGMWTKVHFNVYRLHYHNDPAGALCERSRTRIDSDVERTLIDQAAYRTRRRQQPLAKAAKKAKPIAELYSDRTPSSSVRAVGGGSPGSGKRQ